MPESMIAVPENVKGRFFVDDTCIYCDLCKLTDPSIFEEHTEGYAYIKKQPTNQEEINLTYEALEGCPTESIGDKENPNIEYKLNESKRWWRFWK